MSMTDEKPLIGIQIFGGDIEETAKAIQQLHIDITIAHLNWGSVEASPGARDWSGVEWWEKLGETGVKIPERVWTMYTVHMHQRGPLPSDLATQSWGSNQMSDRFEAFVADASERAGWKKGRPIVLIGNEVDAWAGQNRAEADDYVEFVAKASAAVKRHAPNARLINTFTEHALDHPFSSDLARALNQYTDLIACDTYDLKGDFTVAMSDIAAYFDKWKSIGDGKPLFINEIGLPSSPHCGSSEEKQAQRVGEVFDYLERFTRAECEGAIWLGLDDWPRQAMRLYVDQVFTGFKDNVAFYEFLCSLGLRKENREPKAGFLEWEKRSAAYHS